jgi:hypothetical protein
VVDDAMMVHTMDEKKVNMAEPNGVNACWLCKNRVGYLYVFTLMSTSSSANKCKEYVIIISGVVICKLFLE